MGQEVCGVKSTLNHTLYQNMLNDTDIIQIEESDNPSNQKLNEAFLNTQIVASWNILQEKTSNLPNLEKIFTLTQSQQKTQSLKPNNQKQVIQNLKQINQDTKFILKETLKIKKYRQSVKPQYQNVQIDISSFVKVRKQNVQDFYDFKEKIGEGTFGNVYKAYEKKNGQVRAIKALKKKSMNNTCKMSFIAELDILKTLDHPNIIKLYDLFLYDGNYYVVTEFCQGGCLQRFFLKRRDQINEEMIKIIMKQVLSVLTYLSNQLIVHRDLKLENIVFWKKPQKNDQNNYQIKIIDFGTAIRVKKHYKNPSGLVGTLYYLAPEFTKGFYTEKCDIWSAGVILFLLLFKQFPYEGSQKQVLQGIANRPIDWKNYMNNASSGALQVVKAMLDRNYLSRLPSSALIRSDWIRSAATILISKQMTDNAANNLAAYNRQNNFVSIVESYLSFRKISQDQRQQMSKIFFQIDQDNSGFIDAEELLRFFRINFSDFNQLDALAIIKNVDKNNSGKLDFNEFLTVMIKKKQILAQEALKEAFDFIDDTGKGFITKKQLKKLLKQADKKQIEQTFKDLDENGDNQISFQQFKDYLSTHLASG